jgi:hypothetical protein
VYVPRLNPPLRVPRYLRSLLLLTIAISCALVAWATLSLSSTKNESVSPGTHLPPAESVRVMAFLSNQDSSDGLYLINADTGTRTVVASFEPRAGMVSRGAASPLADTVAVLHPAQHNGSRLTFVSIPTGVRTTSPAILNSDAPLVWSVDGSLLLTSTSLIADGTGRTSVTILAVEPKSGTTTSVATFESVFQAVPLGHDPETGAVTVVVVNPAGSSIWVAEGGTTREVGAISSGRTRDWAVSPDQRYVAFVETRNGATVPSVGRVAEISTGRMLDVTEVPLAQEGVAWHPGVVSPVFGGPGATLNLPGSAKHAYLVPSSWAPLGDALVARVVTPGESETSTAAWELLKPGPGDERKNQLSGVHGEMTVAASTSMGERSVLFAQAGKANFAGWVQAGEAD